MLQARMRITVLTAAFIGVGLSGCQVAQKMRTALRPKRCTQCEQNALPHGHSDPDGGLHPIPDNGDTAPPIPGNVPRIPPAPAASTETGLRRIPLPQDYPVAENKKPTLLQRVKFGLGKLNPLKSKQQAAPVMQPTLAPANEGLRPTAEQRLPQLNFPEPAEPQHGLHGPTFGEPHTTSIERQATPSFGGHSDVVEDWPYSAGNSGATMTATNRHHYSEPELLNNFRPAMTFDRPVAQPVPQQPIPVVRRKAGPHRVPATPVAQPRQLVMEPEQSREMPEQFPRYQAEPSYTGPRFTPVAVPAESSVPTGGYRNYRNGNAQSAPTTSRFADAPVRNFN